MRNKAVHIDKHTGAVVLAPVFHAMRCCQCQEKPTYESLRFSMDITLWLFIPKSSLEIVFVLKVTG